MENKEKTSTTAQNDFMGVINYLSHFHPVYDCADEIAARLVRMHLPAKTVILKPGQIATCFYFIENGALKATEVRDGKEFINWILFGPSMAHNGRSFYSQSPGTELVDTVEPTVVSMMDHEDIYYLINKYHSFAACVVKLLGHIIAMREINFSLMVSVPDLETRVRRMAMLYPGLLTRVPLRLLAVYLRMTPETLSRIINKPEFADLKSKTE